MKKLIALTLILAIALTLSVAPVQAEPEDLVGQILPDFTVKTIDGSTFTLSESLKTHDLVLVNFWASWCGPCCMEFPHLETAWERYSDRVDVIALSVEETDTFDTLKGFAGQNGLKFHIGRDETKMFDQMGGSAIPTTLLIDKNRRVVSVEIGSKSSVEEFTGLFDKHLSQASPMLQDPNQNSSQRIVFFIDNIDNKEIPIT